MTLDATVGGASSNSYCTVATATLYLAQRLHVDPWYQLLPVTEGYQSLAHQREAALIWATHLMDTQVLWFGMPATPTQALAWPQTGQVDSWHRPIAEDVIPDNIQRATAYYALALLHDAREASSSTTDTGTIKSRKVGDLQITYHDPRPTTTSTRPAAQVIPAEVRALLQPYASVPGGMTVLLRRT